MNYLAHGWRFAEQPYFLAGTAVGAALGLLLAPRSGEETRERLADWIKDRREKGEELLHKAKEAYRERREGHGV